MSIDNKTHATNTYLTMPEWEVALHLAQLLNLIIPASGLFSAAAIWKVKGKESQKIYRQGKEVLNFQIAVIFASIFVGLLRSLSFSAFLPTAALTVTTTLMILVVGVQIYFPLIAALRVNDGKEPSYPKVLHFFN